MTYELRSANNTDKSEILKWRNARHVRKVMINQHIISPEEHDDWWNRVSRDDSVEILIIEEKGIPLGVLTFYDIILSETAWWGFYLTDKGGAEADTFKVWVNLEEIAIVYAFENLRVKTLKCETRASNQRVLLLHQRFMFKEIEKIKLENNSSDWLITSCLQKSEYEVLKEKKLQTHAYETVAKKPKKFNSMRILMIGSANWEEIASEIQQYLEENSIWYVEVHVPPFGQGMLELFDTERRQFYSSFDYFIFCERLEDFVNPTDTITAADTWLIKQNYKDYISQIESLRDVYPAKFIINDFKTIRPRTLSMAEMVDTSEPIHRIVVQMNAELIQLAKRMNDTYVFPLRQVIDDLGRKAADPGKYWLLGRFPYGPKFGISYAKLLLGYLLSMNELTARAIVLDLDNTCWGGVVGDDGIKNIKIGSDYPGNQFVAFQKFVKTLMDRGIAVTLCSKNDEETALKVFSDRKEMVLSLQDIITHRINWTAKSHNIREIASELGLGLQNLIFIDDNPMERLEVKQNAFGVIVPEMPSDVSKWPEFLSKLPALSSVKILDSDQKRIAKYKIKKKIELEQKNFSDKKSFLKNLEMRIEMRNLSTRSYERTLQLITKTNQYNVTGLRLDEKQIDAFVKANNDIVTIKISDKFGSDEIVAVVLLAYNAISAEIVNFVMSCRVLGRGVETAVLAEICNRAKHRNCEEVVGRIVRTERNKPCQSLYFDHGFTSEGDGIFKLKLECSVEYPAWFTY